MENTKDKRKTCFIVTPIGGNGSSIRRKIDGIIDEVIQPVLDEFDYEMLVSHRICDSGSVTNAIISKVYESDLVIANLTGNNPNVMYEVALRHASAKPIIHITENIGDLPFDINDQRTIPYTDDMAGAVLLKQELRNMIKSINFEELAVNPVTLALGKRNLVNLPESVNKDFAEVFMQILDEVKMLSKEVAMLKGSKFMRDRFYNYMQLIYERNFLNDNEKKQKVTDDYIIEISTLENVDKS